MEHFSVMKSSAEKQIIVTSKLNLQRISKREKKNEKKVR